MTLNADLVGRYLTAGRLRELLADRPAEEKIVVHVGWDFPVLDDADDYPQPDDDEFVLFPDYDDSAAMVSKWWLENYQHLPPNGSLETG